MSIWKKMVVLLGIISMFMFSNLVIADVGDFESYDSDWGSSWDSDWDSDWDSSWDSDWGSSWDSDYDSSGGYSSYRHSSSASRYNKVVSLFYVGIIVFIVVKATQNNSKNRPRRSDAYIPNHNRGTGGYVRSGVRSEAVANKVREVDKFFNDEKFLSWVKNIFVKLQTAWSERDWETIRPFESESLFEQHSKQLQGYIERKQINKMERICVNYAELVSFNQDSEKDILIVALNSSMTDYIIDEETGKVLKGSKDTRLTNTYKLTFTRKKGVLTEEGTEQVHTTNCPNCGAPTTITSSGKCEFCGSVITIGSHDWVLTDMERF